MPNEVSSNSCYIFRINYDDAHAWVLKEMEEKSFLRQGWGRLGLSLTMENGSIVPFSRWVANWPPEWNESDERKRSIYDILLRMTHIVKGDLLVIPKTRANDTFGICKASGSYRFDAKNKTMWDDFRHVIPIEGLKHFHYAANAESKLISAKFRSYQSPVNNVWNDEVRQALHDVYEKDADSKPKKMIQIWRDILKKATRPAAHEILRIDPVSFEDLLAKCLETKGYVILQRHRYDSQGSDVDIIASFRPPFIGEVLDSDFTFLIQVKKKSGKDSDFRKGIDQLILAKKEYPIAQLILMNSTNDLNDDEKKCAYDNGVKVIHGSELIELILTSNLTSEHLNSEDAITHRNDSKEE